MSIKIGRIAGQFSGKVHGFRLQGDRVVKALCGRRASGIIESQSDSTIEEITCKKCLSKIRRTK